MNLDKIITISEKSLVKYAGEKKSMIRLIRAFVLLIWKCCFFLCVCTFLLQLLFQRKSLLLQGWESFPSRVGQNQQRGCSDSLKFFLAERSEVPLFPKPFPFLPLQNINFSKPVHFPPYIQMSFFLPRKGMTWCYERASARGASPRGTEVHVNGDGDPWNTPAWPEGKSYWGRRELHPYRHQDNKQLYGYLDWSEHTHGFRNKLLYGTK